MSHVAGYAVSHDVSARDWQLKKNGGQWLLGKCPDGFAPLGPLVTLDEVGAGRGGGPEGRAVRACLHPGLFRLPPPAQVGDPHKLRMRTILNGAVVQVRAGWGGRGRRGVGAGGSTTVFPRRPAAAGRHDRDDGLQDGGDHLVDLEARDAQAWRRHPDRVRPRRAPLVPRALPPSIPLPFRPRLQHTPRRRLLPQAAAVAEGRRRRDLRDREARRRDEHRRRRSPLRRLSLSLGG